MSNTWTGLGIGTKSSDGEWLEMFFSEKNISSSDLDNSGDVFEKVTVSAVSYTHLTLPTNREV